MTGPLLWRRDLSEFVSVATDGRIGDMDPDVTKRSPGRVLISMPDFTADVVAHALDSLGELADRVGLDREWTGERELALALRQAAQAGGFHCPNARVRDGGAR